MNECKNCKQPIEGGNMLECPNCGASFCENCAKETQRICPYCYSNLEFLG